MIWLAMLLQVATPAAQAAPQSNAGAAQEGDIVVVGRGIESAQAALDACVARGCPPDQEIKAALVVASRRFLAGDYAGSRQTLLKTRGRTGKADAAYPLAVSDLHRALNTIGNLDGREDSARLSAFDATDALRAGLKPNDPLILLQRLDSANQLTRTGRIEAARQIYEDVIKRAAKNGYPGVEGEAIFQAATLYATLASLNPNFRDAADRWAARLDKRDEPEIVQYREGIRLVKLQLAASKASPEERAALLAQAKPLATRDAFLLSEPDVTFNVSNPIHRSVQTGALSGGTSEKPEWADVAFFVRPDGTVADVSVVAQSDVKPGSWLSIKTDAVTGRRYAPFNGAPIYRVERYTMVHNYSEATGTHLKMRSARGILNTTDVTKAYQAPAA
ncbi:hypothetical protein SAMN05216382_3078 [Sphingomonas palmae]|uniref:Tetratricopeptide repeat-containing protein n=1 Tax=Sphingomonas palmae TaxID=1855283 RepID=A0A1H7UV91_9SPHN|nr:hypothetical protein [Sphingomonas palmae]SEM00659.1 hypothetical protein SAMN05216382_3078 [Sphingomonas palmae]